MLHKKIRKLPVSGKRSAQKKPEEGEEREVYALESFLCLGGRHNGVVRLGCIESELAAGAKDGAANQRPGSHLLATIGADDDFHGLK